MKKIIPLALSLIFTNLCIAEIKDSELFPTNIPKRVRYTRPTQKEAQAAKLLLEKQFIKNEQADLFGDVAAIYPPLWQEIHTKKPYKDDPGGKFISYCDGKKLDGKALKSKESLSSLTTYLCAKFPKPENTTIRPPDYDDLQKYWSVIGWDLDSPLFVIENKKHKYIFQFSDGRIFTIFDLNSMTL